MRFITFYFSVAQEESSGREEPRAFLRCEISRHISKQPDFAPHFLFKKILCLFVGGSGCVCLVFSTQHRPLKSY